MRIAVIGSGISGMICARLLHRDHELTIFEANSRIGGHTNTVAVELNGTEYQIDTGFIVYNERTYPHFTQILVDLKVETLPTSMSFSVHCDQTGMEYNGSTLNTFFAQRTNLFRPSFLRLLRDILKFNRDGYKDFETVPPDQTIYQYLSTKGFSKQFAEKYLLPMGAAIWSCPCEQFGEFPIRFILEFYINHGLLSLTNRPVWRVIKGGSKEYVKKLTQPYADRIRLSCPVKSVRRLENQVVVSHEQGEEIFDEVIFACHSDQALRLLNDPDELETELLSAFPYSQNTAVLHTDESVLPKRKRVWASWNYHLAQEQTSRPTVTYNMNILQNISSSETFCVTMNEEERIDSDKILATFQYSHPLFTLQRATTQQRHHEVIRHRNTSFCGAYWRNGFHEDGVVSALAVCRRFGIPGWNSEKGQA